MPRLGPATYLPALPKKLVDPLGVITFVCKQPLRLAATPCSIQQVPRFDFVVLRTAADAGHHGLVLLLDEVENLNQQYDIRGRRKSYDTLGRGPVKQAS